jgi:tRNA pseudouridine38-40 synthase
MRNILLLVSYDGTDFCGWQRQDHANSGISVRTVQRELESALSRLHKSPVILYGSGRTDSGVHAVSQAANFFSPIDSIPVEKYVPALNCLLPLDIRINHASEVPESFNARFSATARTYRYFMHCGESPLASEMRYIWAIHHRPDISVLNEMASCLRGELDCAAFAAVGDESKSSFRYLENAFFCLEGDRLIFEITANAFLWKMVRTITGSLIYFEKSGKSPEFFQSVLESRNRQRAGPTAPAQGLFLWSVNFSGVRKHI